MRHVEGSDGTGATGADRGAADEAVDEAADAGKPGVLDEGETAEIVEAGDDLPPKAP